jgi:hypothetical protein
VNWASESSTPEPPQEHSGTSPIQTMIRNVGTALAAKAGHDTAAVVFTVVLADNTPTVVVPAVLVASRPPATPYPDRTTTSGRSLPVLMAALPQIPGAR